MIQVILTIDRRKAVEADAKRLNGNGAYSTVSEQGFGGSSATNKAAGDGHFS